MASLSLMSFIGQLMQQKKRQSATNLQNHPNVIPRLVAVIDDLLVEHALYKRQGYPRAGGFDRLAIMAIQTVDCKKIAINYWLPAPRMLYQRHFITQGQLASLVQMKMSMDEKIQGLVLVGQRTKPGAFKYGEKNKHFAQLEQGIFLQALHMRLCQESIPNHLQGGLNIDALPLSFHPDVEQLIGLVV